MATDMNISSVRCGKKDAAKRKMISFEIFFWKHCDFFFPFSLNEKVLLIIGFEFVYANNSENDSEFQIFLNGVIS